MAGRFIPQQNLEAAVKRPLDTAMSMVSPLLKTPYEILANKNTFNDRPLDSVAGSGVGALVDPLIGKPHELAGQKTFGAELPAGWQYLLGQSPLGRTTNELSTGSRGIGLTSDPYKGEMGPGEALLWWLTGGKAMPWDETKQTSHRQYEYKKRLQDVRAKKSWALKKGDDKAYTHYQQIEDRIRQEENPALLGITEGAH